MNKKILLIEDDQKKVDDIKSFIIDNYKNIDLTIKESYQSGLKEIMTNEFDLLMLDMSLPTWDLADYEGVGSFEKFGGFKIMKEMDRKKKIVKTILITMFDDFGESDSSITLNQIDEIFSTQFSQFYMGYVFYNSKESNWKEILALKLNNMR